MDLSVWPLAYVMDCSLMMINPPKGAGTGMSLDAVGSILGIFQVPV